MNVYLVEFERDADPNGAGIRPAKSVVIAKDYDHARMLARDDYFPTRPAVRDCTLLGPAPEYGYGCVICQETREG